MDWTVSLQREDGTVVELSGGADCEGGSIGEVAKGALNLALEEHAAVDLQITGVTIRVSERIILASNGTENSEV